MRRQVSPVVVVVAAVVVLVFATVLWMYRQHSSRVETETIRREVEQQMYQEGELGHRPGEVPVRSSGR